MTTTYEPGIQRIATGEVEWSGWECAELPAQRYALQLAHMREIERPAQDWDPIVREVVR